MSNNIYFIFWLLEFYWFSTAAQGNLVWNGILEELAVKWAWWIISWFDIQAKNIAKLILWFWGLWSCYCWLYDYVGFLNWCCKPIWSFDTFSLLFLLNWPLRSLINQIHQYSPKALSRNSWPKIDTGLLGNTFYYKWLLRFLLALATNYSLLQRPNNLNQEVFVLCPLNKLWIFQHFYSFENILLLIESLIYFSHLLLNFKRLERF